MKRILSVITACWLASLQAFAQCPDTTITDDGFHPPSDSLDCVVRGMAFSESIQVNVPATLATPIGSVTVTSVVINDVTGEPAGIVNDCTPANCTFNGGSSGCINFSGITNDPAGAYPIDFVVTVSVNVPIFGAQSYGPASIDSLLAQLAQLPIPVQVPFLSNIDYELKVIEPGAPCAPLLAVSISGNTTICPGESTTLTANVDNASGNETYRWSPGGQTTPSITVTSTGMYSVEVADQGDTATASVTVVAGQAPTAGFTVLSFSLDATFTNTSSANATSFSWNFGDGSSSTSASPSHRYSAAGTYTVRLIASNGCGADTATQQLTLTVAPCSLDSSVTVRGVSPGPNAIPCIERGVPYSQTMQIFNFDTLIGFSGVAITVNYAQIDSVENLPCGITWQSNKMRYAPGERGCILVSGTSKEVVGQYPLKIYMTLEINVPILGTTTQSGELNDLIGQLNGILALVGQPPLNFDYRYISRVIENGTTACPPRDTTATATASGSGSANACPAFMVDIEGNPTICSGQPTTLTAVPKYYNGSISGVTYQWGPGNQTSASISVSAAGSYSVTVTAAGATASDNVNVSEGTMPDASFTATASGRVVTITQNNTAGSTPINYVWNWGDNSTSSGQIPPPHTYAQNGNFTITLTATNSCGSDTYTQSVTVTGIGQVENNLGFDVFPNPSAGSFYITLTNNASTRVNLRVFDLSGKMVYKENISDAGSAINRQLDLSALPRGVYTLHLNSEAGNGIQKLMLY